jgi:hypothetical protein
MATKLTCPNRRHPDWIKLENAVGEFEAFRDYMQYQTIRDPFVVFEKLNQRSKLKITKKRLYESDVKTRKLIKATEKYEVGLAASVFQRIRNTSFDYVAEGAKPDNFVISQKAWKQDENDPDVTLVTIRKMYTEEDAARAAKNGEYAVPRTKDKAKWDALKMILYYEDSLGHDVKFIQLQETDDVYMIKVPTKIYKTALTQKVMPDNFVSYFRGNDNEAINISSDSVLGNVINNMGSPAISPTERNNAQATSQVSVIAEKLASNLKVQGKSLAYEFITPERANEIHEGMNASWNGEKAFFAQNKVYFVGNNMSLDIVFHEFSHPVVRSLAKSNPELFNKLFVELTSTVEGQKVLAEVAELYPEYNETDMLFKEEALVRALTLAATMAKQAELKSSVFAKLVSKILTALRQLLRKLGVKNSPRDISKLSENTTLQELSEMMLSSEETLELGKEAYSDADVVAYVREMHEFTNDILKMDEKDLLSLNIKGYSVAKDMIDKLKTSQNYKEIAKILVGEYGEKDLQSIQKALNPYTKSLIEGIDTVKNKIQHDEDRARAMVNTLFRLQSIMKKLKDHLVLLNEEKDNIDNMNKAFYYEYFVNYWQGYAKEFMQIIMSKENIDKIKLDSPLASLVSSINNQMEQVLTYTKSFKKDGAGEFLSVVLGDAMKRMSEKHEKVIAHLTATGGKTAQKLIDREMEEYHGLNKQETARRDELADKKNTIGLVEKEELEYNQLVRKSFSGAALTPEKIKMALEGKIDDANIFNSFFEGYMYNADPIVGGFALFVKNNLNDVMTVTQGKFNSYAHEMAPLLAKGGYTPADTDKLIKRIADVEEIGTVDKATGEVVGKPVWTLKSAHKNWRIDVDKVAHAKEKAEREWLRTNTEEAKQAFIQASAAESAFQRQFFHQKYKQEVYAADALLEKDELGKRARFAMKEVLKKLSRLTDPLTNKMDELNNEDLTASIWQEYNQLFSITDAFGQLKPKDSEEYNIAIRLKEYKAASIDPVTGKPYTHWVLREGEFQKALDEFKQELVDSDIQMGSKEYNAEVRKWLDKNLRTVIKPEFYDKRKELTTELNDLLSKLPSADKKMKKGAEIYEKIFSILKGYRDEDGQPNGLELTPEALAEITWLEKDLRDFNEMLEKVSGLTQEEEDELKELYSRRQAYGTQNSLTDEEKARRAELEQKKKDQGLSSLAQKRIRAIYFELSELQSKVPTTHYLSIINMWAKELGHPSYITQENLQKFYDSLTHYKYKNKDFAKWYDENHRETRRFDYQLNDEVVTVHRSHAWNNIQPNDEAYYETTPITDDNGNVVFEQGLPALKYYVKMVKPEYITPKEVGVTVDNMGNYLPRLDVADSPYINHEYLKMKDTDPAHYAILEAMKKHHLKNQEGAPMKSRLYLDIPRFRKNTLELLQTKNLKQLSKSASAGSLPFLTNLIERAKDFFRKAKDKKGTDYNWEDDAMLIRMDMFDNEVASVPIHGLYDLPIDDVSLDVNQSLMRYMFSVERQKKLIEINPAARALQATLNDPANATKDFGKINKFNFLHRGLVTYFNKKGKYVRRDAVNALIEREFEGKVDAGFTKDSPFLQNASELIFQRAGFAFFALNIPSAVKNMLGAKFQSMVEGSGGVHVDHASLAKGEVFGTKAMGDISLNIYKHNEKPLSIQIVDLFDMIKGRAEGKLPESMSRTFAHDLVNFSWLYNFRKWTEGQASIQLGSAMLFKEKVEQNGKKIDYMDAWELSPDGVITLKSGIDVRYGSRAYTYTIEEGDTHESIATKLAIPLEEFMEIAPAELKIGRDITVENNKFNGVKNKMGMVQNNLNGAYDKFDQPEAQRYLAFRFISFMKRYFTTMFVNRWGYSGPFGKARGRFNPGMGDTQEGTYITVLKTLYRTFSMGADYYKFMNKEEKAAWIKFTVEVGSIVALLAVLAPLLGWDPEDPDRYEKLRKRSGAFPLLGVPEDPAHPFHAGGYMMNHLLKMTLDVRAENEAFVPWPHMGLDNYMNTVTDASSVSFGPTLKSYKKMLEFAYYEATGNSKARYKKQAGPYEWQQEGGSKLVTEMAKAFGITGSSVDPVTNIKNVYGNK